MNNVPDKSVAADYARAALIRQIEALVARLHPGVARERRHDERLTIPVLFRLTPLDANHEPIPSQSSIVVGKNISRRGMGFFHERPMPHRRAIIELAQPGLGSFAAEIDVNWCRFTRPGWYESGGRLIRVATQKLELSGVGVEPFTAAMPALAQTTGEFGCRGECHV